MSCSKSSWQKPHLISVRPSSTSCSSLLVHLLTAFSATGKLKTPWKSWSDNSCMLKLSHCVKMMILQLEFYFQENGQSHRGSNLASREDGKLQLCWFGQKKPCIFYALSKGAWWPQLRLPVVDVLPQKPRDRTPHRKSRCTSVLMSAKKKKTAPWPDPLFRAWTATTAASFWVVAIDAALMWNDYPQHLSWVHLTQKLTFDLCTSSGSAVTSLMCTRSEQDFQEKMFQFS